MTDKPIVSVIIPVYNTEKYLNQCLDTILSQTFQDFEIICIDDSSNDNSWNILQEYAENYSKFKCIKNKENKGAAYCRNLGIKLSTGEYLIFLDSDDYFDKQMLEKGVNTLKNEADIVWWDCFLHDDRTDKLYYTSKTSEYFKRKVDMPFSPNEFADFLFDILPEAPWHRMYRREMIISNELWFQSLPNSNDVYFGFVSLLFAKKIVYLQDRLIFHRYNRFKQITETRGKNPICIYKAIVEIYTRMTQNNIFSIYKKTFYCKVLDIIMYGMYAPGSDDKSRADFANFILKKGMQNLDMTDLTRNDFVSEFDFMRWKAIVLKQDWNLAVKIHYDLLYSDSLINNLKALGKNFCLWGFGRRGKKFFNIAHNYNLNIVCIIDENPNLWLTKVKGLNIKPIETQNIKFDTVLLTNYYYYNNVKETLIKNKMPNVKIIDIASSIKYNLPIETCVY